MVIDPFLATRLIGPGFLKTVTALYKRQNVPDNPNPEQEQKIFDESLRTLRNILTFVCHTRIEDLHFITTMHTPLPPSVLSNEFEIPVKFYEDAASIVRAQLGPNIDRVGATWWEWRKPGSVWKARWVETKTDHDNRMRDPSNEDTKRVMFYIHGGAYYLGGIGHDMQIARHARKLKGRCFAPTYRLAPEYPFPCAIQDIVAAYLFMLTQVEARHVVISGDSAGGGLSLALLLVIRDQKLPVPAGASLISPWVDLTHSFPSIMMPAPFDYVPATGFHAKHSVAWPPPSREEMRQLGLREQDLGPDYMIEVDGKQVPLVEQVQMYAPNLQCVYPLVSAVHAATLGGFPPCQVIAGGGELLRDEQLFLAHKMANPGAFPLAPMVQERNLENPADINKYPPTAVELLLFDDGPHAAPTLGHVDIAKHQYRAISRFSAWAIANAGGSIEGTGVSKGPVASQMDFQTAFAMPDRPPATREYIQARAGDALPAFEHNMRRYRVDRLGGLYKLEPESDIRALCIPWNEIGVPRAETLKGWIAYRADLDKKFASARKRAIEKRRANVAKGYVPVPNGEIPPATALVGRRVVGEKDDPSRPHYSTNLWAGGRS